LSCFLHTTIPAFEWTEENHVESLSNRLWGEGLSRFSAYD